MCICYKETTLKWFCSLAANVCTQVKDDRQNIIIDLEGRGGRGKYFITLGTLVVFFSLWQLEPPPQSSRDVKVNEISLHKRKFGNGCLSWNRQTDVYIQSDSFSNKFRYTSVLILRLSISGF